MTEIDKERVIIYRRNISNLDNSTYEFLSKLDDVKLLELINSTVLANSLSKNNFKYALLTQLVFNNDTEKSIKKISTLVEVINNQSKDLFKFGLFYGFDSSNIDYQYSRFIKTSVKPEIGENIFKKKISSSFFRSVFPFFYKIIYKGDRNESFPRI